MKPGDKKGKEEVLILSGSLVLAVAPYMPPMEGQGQASGPSRVTSPSRSVLVDSVRAVTERAGPSAAAAGATPGPALRPEERILLSFVDGRRPLREVMQLSGLPGPVARAHLQGLFERGVVIAADPRTPAGPRPGGTPPGLPVLASALPASLAPVPADGAASGELRPGQRITRDLVSGGSAAGAGAGPPTDPVDAGVAAADAQPRVTVGAGGAVKIETPALWGRPQAVSPSPTPSPVVIYQPPPVLPPPPLSALRQVALPTLVRGPEEEPHASEWADLETPPPITDKRPGSGPGPAPAGGRRVRPFRVGAYEVATRIGQGTLGSIYICRRVGSAGFQRLFALKVVRRGSGQEDAAVRSFINEGRVGGLVAHPNLQAVVDMGTYRDQPFLVLDYIDGASLADLMVDGRRLPAPVVVTILLDLLRGLQSTHDTVDPTGRTLGLVHGDVSPPNILIGIDGASRLCDFGSARFTAPGEPRLSEPVVPGKPAFMAPEQLHGESIDARTDVFAAAVVMWTALTGEDLFAAATPEETVINVLKKRIVPPSAFGAPACLDDVCMRALNRSRQARFFTAEEMSQQLLRVASAADLVASPRQVGQLVREQCDDRLVERRRRTQAAFGAAPTATVVAESWSPLNQTRIAASSPSAQTIRVAALTGGQGGGSPRSSSSVAPTVNASLEQPLPPAPPPARSPSPLPSPSFASPASPSPSPAILPPPTGEPTPQDLVSPGRRYAVGRRGGPSAAERRAETRRRRNRRLSIGLGLGLGVLVAAGVVAALRLVSRTIAPADQAAHVPVPAPLPAVEPPPAAGLPAAVAEPTAAAPAPRR